MFSRSLVSAFLGIAFAFILLGCSGGSTPLTPDPNNSGDSSPSITREQTTLSNPHNPWGMWLVRIEAATGATEVIPLRSVMWHINAIPFLEKNHQSTIIFKDVVVDQAAVELNVGLLHPFPTLYQWSGFDVRGIFISDGSFNNFASNGDLVMSDVDEPRLVNADGWTRWWNPYEFPSNETILGHVDGLYGLKDSEIHFQNTLNPYKYFSDDLSQTEDFPQDLDFDRRGIFTAGSSIKYRHYSIDFGDTQNWYVFNYAVDACHMFDSSYDGYSTPSLSELPDPFFPIEANMPEAFAIEVEPSVNTLYWADDTHFGGDIVLDINIFDWQGIQSAHGIPGEIEEIRVESPALKGTEVITTANVTGSDPNYSTYIVELTNCHPDGLLNQEILVTVISNEGTYGVGYDEFDTTYNGNPSDKICAYYLYTPSVSPEIPTQDEILTVINPNGGEVLAAGTSHDIIWFSTGGIANVNIEYDAGSGWQTIQGGAPNTHSYSWNVPVGLASTTVKIRIYDASDIDPVDESDDFFSVDYVDVTFPNQSGDDFNVGVTGQLITWDTGGGTDVVANVEIEFSENGLSGPWNTLLGAGNLPNTGSWEWVPTLDDVTTNGRIKITDVDHSLINDTSDANFVVSELPTITVTSPNGGEVWVSGEQHDIIWSSTGPITFVNIYYSINGGSDWSPITTHANNNGVYENWDTSLIASADMLVQVCNEYLFVPLDNSDAVFAIDNIHVTCPNTASDDYIVGTAKNITWTTGTGPGGFIQNVHIEFSMTGESGTFSTLVGSTPNDGSCPWTPVIGDVTTLGRIRITDVDHPVYTDMSNADFEVFEKAELTLAEYRSWFTGGIKNYRGQQTSSMPAQSYYNGTITSWDFTSAPLFAAIGGIDMQVTFNNNVPRIAGAPSWGTDSLGMRTSINGPAGRRAWWVFRFNTGTNRLYNRGSSYYKDATFTDITWPGLCIDYIECDMTEQFGISTTNDIQFPLDEDSATTTLSGNGFLYWVNNDWLCSQYNDQWAVNYASGSEWNVLAYGDVTVPHSGGTTYPHCLLIKLKVNIGLPAQIVHTGQLLYQWIDCDTGLVVAFIWTHNEGNSTAGAPYTYGYTGNLVNQGIIAAYN